MNQYIDRIIQGDALQVLKDLPDNLADMCVTSPPYWGLRDYRVNGQIGLESTLDEWVVKMVDVFREVRRVMKPTATLWLNLGDSYNSGRPGSRDPGRWPTQARNDHKIPKPTASVKFKDLLGIPWRLAFALQDDGWYLRRDIVWHKKNPMPESVNDRPTTAHEYIFLMAKSRRYYYDADAVKEPVSPNTHLRISQATVMQQMGGEKQKAYKENFPGQKHLCRTPSEITKSMAAKLGVNPKAAIPSGWNTGKGNHRDLTGRYPRVKQNESFASATAMPVLYRNKRSVWTIPVFPFSGAHFATFPPALIEPCIKAGCPAAGLVLDPFMGSGTTGLVARSLGRHYLGIELNREYIEIAERRIAAPFRPAAKRRARSESFLELPL